MSRMDQTASGRFTDLSPAARNTVYVINGLLIVGWMILIVFASSLLLLGGPFVVLPEPANNGNVVPLPVELAIIIWFAAGPCFFIAVIIVAAGENRWSRAARKSRRLRAARRSKEF